MSWFKLEKDTHGIMIDDQAADAFGWALPTRHFNLFVSSHWRHAMSWGKE